MVLAAGSSAPTSAEVKALTGPGGSAPAGSATAVGGQGGVTLSATTTGLAALTQYEVYCVAQDGAATPNLQASPVHESVTTSAPGPHFVGGYPAMSDATDKSGTLSIRLTKAGTAYFIAVPSTVAQTPTSEQVKANTFAQAEPGSHGSVHVPPALAEVTTTVSGMQPSTAYRVWVAAEDQEDPPNLMVSPSHALMTTGPDATPPDAAAGFPLLDSARDTAVDVSLQLNEEGTVAWVVHEVGVSAPAYATVSAVLDGTSAPDPAVSSTAVVGSRNTPVVFTVTGLRSSTAYVAYMVVQDDHSPTPNRAAALLPTVSFTTMDDVTPPTFVAGFPSVSARLQRGATAAAKINEAGRIFGIILPHSAPVPTAAQVRAEGLGNPPAGQGVAGGVLGFGNGGVGPNDVFSVSSSTQLVEDTTYSAWFVAEDLATPVNLQATASKVSFNTLPDTTAPELATGYPALWDLADTSFTIEVRLDEIGRFYAVVVAAGSVAPNVAEVRAGQAPTTVFFAGTNTASTEAGSQAVGGLLQVTGVTHTTSYDVWVTAEDDQPSPNKMSSVAKLSVTTQTDATPPQWVGTPSVFDIDDFAVSFSATIDEEGSVHYVVWPAAEAAPPAQTVRKHENPDGGPLLLAGEVAATTPGQAVTRTITSGLAADTNYVLYLAAVDDEGQLPNLQSEIRALPFTTLVDHTAPVFGAGTPRVTALEDFSFTLEVIVDEPGVVFFAALPSGESAPTSAQVLGGNFGVNAVTGSFDVADPSAVAVHKVDEGVKHSTGYDIYIVARDGVSSPNVQAAPTLLSVTTLADGSPPEWTQSPEATTVGDFLVEVQFTLDEAAEVYVDAGSRVAVC